ncbi:hypothetical protein Y032_0047g1537 [Ancylostoma ceylanicum]|uniref:Uncharacterized protein n=1 Tax=Ancylostoma ceylanicum TaxID=53326 RepID=A0A016UBP5_9BILA|nr:hypothetical protein Y032_0047g1537 [Ancylostoma ceylanicum]
MRLCRVLVEAPQKPWSFSARTGDDLATKHCVAEVLTMDFALPFGQEKEGQPRYQATVKEAYDSWHKCISDILSPILVDPEKLWSSFRGAVDHCYDTTPMRNIRMTGVSNKDEFKFHIFNSTDVFRPISAMFRYAKDRLLCLPQLQ